MAINDWEKALGELIQFKYSKDEDSNQISKLNLKRIKEIKLEKLRRISIHVGLLIM